MKANLSRLGRSLVAIWLLVNGGQVLDISYRIENIGGARRNRTADLLHAMQALSQLSYDPTFLKSRGYTGIGIPNCGANLVRVWPMIKQNLVDPWLAIKQS